MTAKQILFAGSAGVGIPGIGDEPDLMTRFGHYVATVWVHENDPPVSVEDIENFDTATVIPDFHQFFGIGRLLDYNRGGTTLEECWLMAQIVTRTPMMCVVNQDAPPSPLGRINRHVTTSAAEMVSILQAIYAEFGQSGGVDVGPPINLLIYHEDGSGHCISINAYDGGVFIYHDPWPGLSLLFKWDQGKTDQIEVGPTKGPERLWVATPGAIERHLYAFFVPYRMWENLHGTGTAGSDSFVWTPRQDVSPAERTQVMDVYLFLVNNQLLSEQGVGDFQTLVRNGKIFDIDREGTMLAVNLQRLVINLHDGGSDPRPLLNHTLRTLADPSSLHQ